MKKCTKCGEEKELSEFCNNIRRKDGKSHRCKACAKKYYEENRKKILRQKKQYHQKNKERQREYYKENKEKIKERKKKYYKENKEKIKKGKKEYYKENKEKIVAYHVKYQINRRKTDPQYKLRRNIGSRISISIRKKGYKKESRTHEILGCSYPCFKRYIEGQFKKGMTWDNYGEWHLDHIKPVSSATTEEEIIALNHYTNFQPMWGKENISKGNTIPVGHQLRII